MGIAEKDRIVWALGLLEANGGGVQKRYLLDKILAIASLSHAHAYSFLAQMRGHEWVKEVEHRDGQPWVMLTDSGVEELQARRAADVVRESP